VARQQESPDGHSADVVDPPVARHIGGVHAPALQATGQAGPLFCHSPAALQD
jgi:hypothetical protein